MRVEMLYSKIHRATVTDANLNYVGSITIDEELMQEANLFVGQKVDIVNINNGERFSTYVIKGKRGNRDICLNGAAARKVHPGDKIIIIAYANMSIEEAKTFKPTVLIVDDNNNIIEKTTYLQEG
jgi:aspartate 1-decarboxylase